MEHEKSGVGVNMGPKIRGKEDAAWGHEEPEITQTDAAELASVSAKVARREAKGLNLPIFTPVRPTRASADVISQIREAIISGQYAPGDRLPTEREMARQFEVSRVTIRDALRSLEAAGLVEVHVGGQGGPYVTHPDLDRLTESMGTHFQLRRITFFELAEVRLALEVTSARLACERATEEDLVELRAMAERPPEGSQFSASAARSVDFHTALVRSAHNRAILAMFMAVRVLIQEAFDLLHKREPDMVDVARNVHRELCRVIEAHDSETAVRIMNEHLNDFIRRAERAAQAERVAGE